MTKGQVEFDHVDYMVVGKYIMTAINSRSGSLGTVGWGTNFRGGLNVKTNQIGPYFNSYVGDIELVVGLNTDAAGRRKIGIKNVTVEDDGITVVHVIPSSLTDMGSGMMTHTHTYFFREDGDNLEIYVDYTIVPDTWNTANGWGPANTEILNDPFKVKLDAAKTAIGYENIANDLLTLWFDWTKRHSAFLVGKDGLSIQFAYVLTESRAKNWTAPKPDPIGIDYKVKWTNPDGTKATERLTPYGYNILNCSATAVDPQDWSVNIPAATSAKISFRLIGPPASQDPGTCTVSPAEGTYLETAFTITCSNWKPPFNLAKALPLSYSLKGSTILVPAGASNVMTPSSSALQIGKRNLTVSICASNGCGCSVSPAEGTYLETAFTITCSNWKPPFNLAKALPLSYSLKGTYLETAFTVTCSNWKPPFNLAKALPLSYSLKSGSKVLVPAGASNVMTPSPDVFSLGKQNLTASICASNGCGCSDVPLNIIVHPKLTVKLEVTVSPPPGTSETLCYKQTVVARCTSSASPYDAYPTLAVQTWSAPNGEPILADLKNSPYFKAVSRVDESLTFTPELRPAFEINKEYNITWTAPNGEPFLADLNKSPYFSSVSRVNDTLVFAPDLRPAFEYLVVVDPEAISSFNNFVDSLKELYNSGQISDSEMISSTADAVAAFADQLQGVTGILDAITALSAVSSSFLNSTLMLKLSNCKPEFDPCDFVDLDLGVYLEQTTKELSAAISSPDWVGTAATGLTGQTEASDSPLANLLNTLIKAPQGRLAK
eukprot:tig00021108_g18346.t1